MYISQTTNEYSINDPLISELDEAFKAWAFFLNNAIGMFAFTLALACLGTKTPAINGLLACIIVGFVRYQGRHIFPKKIVELRAAAKSDPKAQILLVGLTQKYMSSKTALTDYTVFVIGFVLLLFVTFSPGIMYFYPSIRAYIGTMGYFF
jgi:hypothetical protein